MSKRHGAVAITEYRENGYIPDAVVNYLARLGWSHGDEEVFSRKQLIELFDVQAVGKAAARFDQSKLDWLNTHYLHCATPESLSEEVMRRLNADISGGPDIARAIQLLQERSKNLNELAEGARFFYAAPMAYVEKAVKKNFKETTWALLDAFIARTDVMQDWTPESIHVLISDLCGEAGINMGKLAQPIRILISGGPVSPPIDATLSLLGKKESLKRIRRGISMLTTGVDAGKGGA